MRWTDQTTAIGLDDIRWVMARDEEMSKCLRERKKERRKEKKKERGNETIVLGGILGYLRNYINRQ